MTVSVDTFADRTRLVIDGRPSLLPAYSPISWRGDFLQRCLPAFAEHGMHAYFLGFGVLPGTQDWGDSYFWHGDTISTTPLKPLQPDMDAQVAFILERDPGARFIIRNLPMNAPSWLRLHPEQAFTAADGTVSTSIASNASEAWWAMGRKAAAACMAWCESRTWAGRILGYWHGLEGEGTHVNLIHHQLYDHSPVMLQAWRAFLAERYASDAALREAWADPAVTRAQAPIPTDLTRTATVVERARQTYWQAGNANARLRDWLDLQQRLWTAGVEELITANRAVHGDHPRLMIYDGFKQHMQGWSNIGFFDTNEPWPAAFPDTLAGTGSMGVARLLDRLGPLDAVLTPYDYQHRQAGGISLPEAIVDSIALRGRFQMAEADVRTWVGAMPSEPDCYGMARDAREYDAIDLRNLADGLIRGYTPYWMDLVADWFGQPDIQRSVARSVAVMKRSAELPRHDVPGIGVILDDRAACDSDGTGNYFHEAVMQELRQGLPRCGVPVRTYLLEDLDHAAMPRHRVWYFPNHFRVDDERLARLRRTVMRDGATVVWGPGSGISDGRTLDAAHANRLTGFTFHWMPQNQPRRVLVQDPGHPISAGLVGTPYGSGLAYGPCLYPADGVRLGIATAKQGKNWAGLAVKAMDGWTSVFTTATGLPPALWRGIARHAGAHVWCEQDEVVMANQELVALHSASPGAKRLLLPSAHRVSDLVSGENLGVQASIAWTADGPQTRLFRIQPV